MSAPALSRARRVMSGGPVLASRRPRRSRSRARWLVAAAVAVVTASAAWLLLGGSPFRVESVSVQGRLERETEQSILTAAGIRTGSPMARVDVAEARRRVERLPAVAAVAVDRRWPDAVVLRVLERVPVGAVQTPVGFALLDAAGVRFAVAPAPPAGVARLVVPTGSADDSPPVTAALDVLASLPEQVRSRVLVASATSPADVALELTGGARVVWGDAAAPARKAAVLAALVARPAAVYDVSSPEVAVTR